MKKYTFELEETGRVFEFIPDWEKQKNYADHGKVMWRNYVLSKLNPADDQKSIKKNGTSSN